jgi:hypothetical protein
MTIEQAEKILADGEYPPFEPGYQVLVELLYPDCPEIREAWYTLTEVRGVMEESDE